jgi:predicted transcriptional regulator
VDFRRPLQTITPTLDGELLRVLARADNDYTGRELARAIDATPPGAQKALSRLVRQGIVLRRGAGRAYLYRFNRDHIAAPWIEGLAGLRQQLFQRMRANINGWEVQPVAAAVFGSVARGQAGPESDLDLFFVRPSAADEEPWEEQVAELAAAATRWTGNDARPLQFNEDEVRGATRESVIQDVLAEGIEIGGSLKRLRKLVRS